MSVLLWVCVISVQSTGYSLEDPHADHTEHAIAADEGGDPKAAIASFRAHVKFHPEDGEGCTYKAYL
jgi:hypothetical protein